MTTDHRVSAQERLAALLREYEMEEPDGGPVVMFAGSVDDLVALILGVSVPAEPGAPDSNPYHPDDPAHEVEERLRRTVDPRLAPRSVPATEPSALPDGFDGLASRCGMGHAEHHYPVVIRALATTPQDPEP